MCSTNYSVFSLSLTLLLTPEIEITELKIKHRSSCKYGVLGRGGQNQKKVNATGKSNSAEDSFCVYCLSF